MDKQKNHAINWKIITCSKERGGLGLKRMKELNSALMTKLAWRLLMEGSKLWALVLRGKYVRGNMAITKLVKKQNSSNAWHGISAAAQTLKKGIKTEVRNGRNALSWRDIWLDSKPLLEEASQDVSLSDSFKTVDYYWIRSKGWNWDMLSNLLPHQALTKLAAVMLSEDDPEAAQYWGPSSKGKFSVKTAYTLAGGGDKLRSRGPVGGNLEA